MTSTQEDSTSNRYSIDIAGVLASAQAFPSQVSLLVDEIDRLLAENAQQKMELEQMSSTFKTVLAIKNRKIRGLAVKGGDETMRDDVKGSNQGVMADASFSFKLPHVSTLTSEPMNIHDPFTVHGIEWVLSVRKNDDHLACTVMGKKIGGDSFPNVTMDIYLYKNGIDNYNVELPETRIHEGTHYYELLNFISFEDLLDEENGYVKDDSTNIEVFIDFFSSENV